MIQLLGKPMIRRYDQVLVYSEKEFRRRLDMTRHIMAQAGLDLLWIVNPSQEGYTAWYTGQIEGDHLLIPLEGDIHVIFDHRLMSFQDPSSYLARRIGQGPVETLVTGTRYDWGLDPNYITDHCQSGKIGILHAGEMRASLARQIRHLLPELQWLPLDLKLGMARAVKSSEERTLINETLRVYEQLFAACPVLFRRHRYLRDAVIDIRHLAHSLGAGGDVQLFATNAGMEDHGQYCDFGLGITDWPTVELQDGMRIFMLMESNSYGGHYVAIGRNFVFGKPYPETVRIFEAALKMQQFAAERFVPGNTLKQIFEENVQYIHSLGFMTNDQNYMHGMGTCPGEMPMTHDGSSENEPLQEHMHLLIHPHVRFDRGPDTGKQPYDDMYNIDTYFVTPNGGVRANHVPSDMIIL